MQLTVQKNVPLTSTPKQAIQSFETKISNTRLRTKFVISQDSWREFMKIKKTCGT